MNEVKNEWSYSSIPLLRLLGVERHNLLGIMMIMVIIIIVTVTLLGAWS
jgi:hypothetical protein